MTFSHLQLLFVYRHEFFVIYSYFIWQKALPAVSLYVYFICCHT